MEWIHCIDFKNPLIRKDFPVLDRYVGRHTATVNGETSIFWVRNSNYDITSIRLFNYRALISIAKYIILSQTAVCVITAIWDTWIFFDSQCSTNFCSPMLCDIPWDRYLLWSFGWKPFQLQTVFAIRMLLTVFVLCSCRLSQVMSPKYWY